MYVYIPNMLNHHRVSHVNPLSFSGHGCDFQDVAFDALDFAPHLARLSFEARHAIFTLGLKEYPFVTWMDMYRWIYYVYMLYIYLYTDLHG